MPKFLVNKREVWTQMVEVDAKDAEEAKFLVSRGRGLMLDNTLEYSHDLPTDCWTVEEE
jgi:electron transfer flavoprotein alpha subunit